MAEDFGDPDQLMRVRVVAGMVLTQNGSAKRGLPLFETAEDHASELVGGVWQHRCKYMLADAYRMKAGETGYDNLTVTGDWTDNHLYLAFMEASFQAEILSARAVAGEKFPIIGEWLNGEAKHKSLF